MKKLGKLKLNPEKLLSHDELVSFRGGSWSGTCGWIHYFAGGGSISRCNTSKQEAIANATDPGDHWCCDSCSQTSYCG